MAKTAREKSGGSSIVARARRLFAEYARHWGVVLLTIFMVVLGSAMRGEVANRVGSSACSAEMKENTCRLAEDLYICSLARYPQLLPTYRDHLQAILQAIPKWVEVGDS